MSTETLSGDVTIMLNGEEHILRPSLTAATTLSNQFDGLSGAFNGIVNRNLAAYQAIVRAGIITAKRISTKDLSEYVYQAGMTKLSPALLDFLSILNNGGRKADADAEADEDADEEDRSGNDHGE